MQCTQALFYKMHVNILYIYIYIYIYISDRRYNVKNFHYFYVQFYVFMYYI